MTMAALYRYTFRKPGSYERKDGTTLIVVTPGASEMGGYQAFKANKDITAEKIGGDKNTEGDD